MPLDIGYLNHISIMVFLVFPAIEYEASGLWVDCFFSYPLSLGILELAHLQGVGLRITEGHGI